MKFYNNKNKCCRYCVHSIQSSAVNEIFCSYRGVMPPEGHCKKYKYDILKRKPERIQPSKNYSPEDFKL